MMSTSPASTPTAIASLRSSHWLFFDVGYTLFDETGGWQEQFERLSTRLAQMGKQMRVDEIWQIYRDACAGFAPGQWRAVCERCAPTPDAVPELMALNQAWRHDLEKPYDGVVEAMEQLSRRYQLGVVANQALGTRDRLERAGLMRYIRVLASSAEAGVVKPDPAIFELALREANSEPAAAAMVGDRIDNDVAPANRLGMRSVHVLQGGSAAQRPRSDDEVATLTVRTVPQLASLLLSE